MDKLTVTLNIVLANTFVMYFQAHSYHWNVEGIMFSQFHDFFGSLYGELHGAVDPIAEEIRALGVYAPINLNEIYHNRTLVEDAFRPSSVETMVSRLIISNNQVIDSLRKAFELATEANNQGLADFIAGRLDVHAKHNWMLNSFLK